MSNKQARAQSERMNLVNLLAVFDDGKVVPLNLAKVNVIDKASGKALFKDLTPKER